MPTALLGMTYDVMLPGGRITSALALHGTLVSVSAIPRTVVALGDAKAAHAGALAWISRVLVARTDLRDVVHDIQSGQKLHDVMAGMRLEMVDISGAPIKFEVKIGTLDSRIDYDAPNITASDRAACEIPWGSFVLWARALQAFFSYCEVAR